MAAFTLAHVIISLVGIGSGFVTIYGFLTAKRLDLWTAIFLATTILTSVTGFMFPFDNGFTPGHAVGILSLLALGVALWARYRTHMAGGWRTGYVISALIAQYFNVAVLIIQSFKHVAPLAELAAQSAAPFLATQVVTLALFIALAIGGVIRFRAVSASGA